MLNIRQAIVSLLIDGLSFDTNLVLLKGMVSIGCSWCNDISILTLQFWETLL